LDMLISIVISLRTLVRTKPLTNLLAKDASFHFYEECPVAFTKLKEALISALILHLPIWGEPFEPTCDTFNYADGVVIGHHIDKKPHVVYYACHTLNDAQLNYMIIEK